MFIRYADDITLITEDDGIFDDLEKEAGWKGAKNNSGQ